MQIKPNTFVIGAMKAGTSSLHVELSRHPDVFMSPFKEPAHFLGPTAAGDPPALSDEYRNDAERYLALFDGAGARPVRGESTTDYTKRPRFEGVAARIHTFDPDARLIYLLRDPVERTISHYWWNVGREGERRDMLTAIAEDPLYQAVSHYAWQLEPYLERFPRAQIHVVTTEALASAPDETLGALFSWLGLRPERVRPSPPARQNVTPEMIAQTRVPFLQRLRFSRAGDVLTRVVPGPIRRAARRVAERPVARGEAPVREVQALLRPIQREQTEHLADLLGRRFPEWRTLYATAP